MIYSIKPKFQELLKPIERLLVKFNVHPTTINFMALLLSIAAGILLYFSGTYLWILIFIPFIAFIRTALNALDGMVARDLNVPNQAFGEVLNEFLDRISDAVIFFGLSLSFYANIVLGSIVTILILLSSYLGIVSKAAGGKREYRGFMGKADRMFWLGLMAVIILVTKNYAFVNYLLWFMLVSMTITIIQRFFLIKKELYK